MRGSSGKSHVTRASKTVCKHPSCHSPSTFTEGTPRTHSCLPPPLTPSRARRAPYRSSAAAARRIRRTGWPLRHEHHAGRSTKPSTTSREVRTDVCRPMASAPPARPSTRFSWPPPRFPRRRRTSILCPQPFSAACTSARASSTFFWYVARSPALRAFSASSNA